MDWFYAKSTGGFYCTEVHGANMPSDAISITQEEYSAVQAAHAYGKIIQAGPDGKPIAVDPPPAFCAWDEGSGEWVLDQDRWMQQFVIPRTKGLFVEAYMEKILSDPNPTGDDYLDQLKVILQGNVPVDTDGKTVLFPEKAATTTVKAVITVQAGNPGKKTVENR